MAGGDATRTSFSGRRKLPAAETVDDVGRGRTGAGGVGGVVRAVIARTREGLEAVELLTGKPLSSVALPVTATSGAGGAYADLNGDGVVDHVQVWRKRPVLSACWDTGQPMVGVIVIARGVRETRKGAGWKERERKRGLSGAARARRGLFVCVRYLVDLVIVLIVAAYKQQEAVLVLAHVPCMRIRKRRLVVGNLVK